jgi:hypothetical protein
LTPQNFAQVLADGVPWIWNLADLHFPGITQLLNFYHAAEHLHATATALWADGIANAWWRRRLNQLKAGEHSTGKHARSEGHSLCFGKGSTINSF